MSDQPSFASPLDIPDVRVISTRLIHEQELLLTVESTQTTAACHRCGRTTSDFDGYDAPRRLRYDAMPGQPISIVFHPKRFRCPYCKDHPTTSQQLRWPTTSAPAEREIELERHV
jgi:transposase